MIGVTEEQAKKIFTELWPGEEFDWDFEAEHFIQSCNRYGLDVMRDAKYDLVKARDAGRNISNELNFLLGCARRIQDREKERSSSKHPRGDDDGVTPSGFNSYNDYFEYLKRKVQEDFPDTKEQAAQRTADFENRRDRLKTLHDEKCEEREKEKGNELL